MASVRKWLRPMYLCQLQHEPLQYTSIVEYLQSAEVVGVCRNLLGGCSIIIDKFGGRFYEWYDGTVTLACGIPLRVGRLGPAAHSTGR